MASPFSNDSYKSHSTFPLSDGGHGEAAINRDSGAVEFSYSWDGVNWSTPVALNIGSKKVSGVQENASGSDRIVLSITKTDNTRILMASDALGAEGSWVDYEN